MKYMHNFPPQPSYISTLLDNTLTPKKLHYLPLTKKHAASQMCADPKRLEITMCII